MTDKYFGQTYWEIPPERLHIHADEKERMPICDHCGNDIAKTMAFCPNCGTELKPQENTLLTELKKGIKDYQISFEKKSKVLDELFVDYANETTTQLNHTHEDILKILKKKFPSNERRYAWSVYSVLGMIMAFLVFGYGINLMENNGEWGGIYALIGLLMSIPCFICYEGFKYQCQWCHEFSNNERRINHDINCLHVRL